MRRDQRRLGKGTLRGKGGGGPFDAGSAAGASSGGGGAD
jgi:hypothetical protein